MRQYVTPANFVTSTSLTSGFLGLVLVPTQPGLAVALVLLAAVLDGVDGALARRAGGDGPFGAQLDSLADLLCFCVVPAYAAHLVVRAALPLLSLPVSCVFLLAGAWRLARFPLVQRSGVFVGLPTPAAGGVLMLLTLWAPVAAVLVGAAGLSALMVSSLRFPSVLAVAASVGGRGRPRRIRPRGRGPAQVPAPLPLRSRLRSSPGPGRPSRERAGRLLRSLTARRVRRRR